MWRETGELAKLTAAILFASARPNARTMRIIAPRGARIDRVEVTVVVVVVVVTNGRENLERIIRRVPL